MTDRELLQQALDALIDAARLMDDEGYTVAFQEEVIIALRARLSQCDRCGKVNPAEIHTCTPMRPEQEPVAWLDSLDSSQPHAVTNFQYLSVSQIERGEQHKYIPVYAAPPRESGCGECGEKASDGWALYCVDCSAPMREWVGLTAAEAAQCWNKGAVQTWKAIEAKLKDKNR